MTVQEFEDRAAPGSRKSVQQLDVVLETRFVVNWQMVFPASAALVMALSFCFLHNGDA